MNHWTVYDEVAAMILGVLREIVLEQRGGTAERAK